MAAYIGIVDLTVRLSSMNPLGHIDVKDASVRFERSLIDACLATHQIAQNPAEMSADGIVQGGASAKFFQFRSEVDLHRFIVDLRYRLLERKLPFKICVRRGELGGTTILERWRSVAEDLEEGSDSDARSRAMRRLSEGLGVETLDAFKRIVSLYRAPNLAEQGLDLSMDLEAFKGFGISIKLDDADDPMVKTNSPDGDQATREGDPIGGPGLFRNHFPVRRSAKHLETVEYFDIPFAFEVDDVVTRHARSNLQDAEQLPSGAESTSEDQDDDEEDEAAEEGIAPKGEVDEDVPAGSHILIQSVVEMLRRSQTADPDNAIYYASILTTFVRSSHFDRMTYRARQEKNGHAHSLAAGWQKYPPIFGTLLLSSKTIVVLRRMTGIELTLAALIDKIYSVISQEPESAAVNGRSPRGNSSPEQRAAIARGEEAVRESKVMKRILRRMNVRYGASNWRRILACPPAVLSEQRKKVVLEIVSHL